MKNNKIHTFDGIIPEIYNKHNNNLIDVALGIDKQEVDPTLWQAYATVYDTDYNVIDYSVKLLTSFGQKRRELTAVCRNYRKIWTQTIVDSVSNLCDLDMSEVKSIETWCNSGKRPLHIDRDETKPLKYTIQNNDYPLYTIVSFPFKESLAGGQMHVLRDTTQADIDNYFLSPEKIAELYPNDQPQYFNWHLKQDYRHTDTEHDTTDTILAYSDRWVSIDAVPGRVVVFPGNCLHFNSIFKGAGFLPRRSVPINLWGKIYGA